MQGRKKKYSVLTRPAGVVPSPFGTGPLSSSTPFGETPLPSSSITAFPLPQKDKGRRFSADFDSLSCEGQNRPRGGRLEMRRGSSPREIMFDIDKVVSHDPGTDIAASRAESRVHRSSVYSMYQDDQSAGEKIEMKLLVLDESERSQEMRKLVEAFHQKVLLCYDHYQPDLTLSCLRIVTALSALKPKPKTPGNNKTGGIRRASSLREPINVDANGQRVFRSRLPRRVDRSNSLKENTKTTSDTSSKVRKDENSTADLASINESTRCPPPSEVCKSKIEDVPVLTQSNQNGPRDVTINPLCAPDPFGDLDVEEALNRELPNFTVARLRATVQQLLRHATLRQDGSLTFPGNSETSIATKSVQYFIWFFDFMDYLQELFSGFVEKIFSPLFKYFHERNFIGANGRTPSMSSAAFTKLSLFSDSDSGHASPEFDGFEDDDAFGGHMRMRSQAQASLLQLAKEYHDIKAIYDTTEIDKVAQRLSFVKEQMDYLLEEEDEVDPDIYSEESRRIVEHLEMDFGTENLIRLVPDMLVKLKKATWLARRWLDFDDQRTKDIKEKVSKLSSIEDQLATRVEMLQDDINKGELKLEQQTDELSRLMDREGRCDALDFKSYGVENQIEELQKKLEQLNVEKGSFPERLNEIVKNKDIPAFHKLKYQFENNKLQRFIFGRKLATLSFQKTLISDDLGLEMLVRPSVIHSSNRLQDECERLEQTLREKREEVVTIKRALMPVQEDRITLTNRLLRQREDPSSWQEKCLANGADLLLSPGRAFYLRSVPVTCKKSCDEVKRSRGVVGQRAQHRLIGQFYVGNNRALRTKTPPLW